MRLWLTLAAYFSFACAAFPAAAVAESDINPAWLQQKTTLEQVEAENTPKASKERVAKFPVLAKPFGFQNPDWETLKALMQPGDEIWTFSSPGESWAALAGRAGIAIVRQGRVIGAIVTMQN